MMPLRFLVYLLVFSSLSLAQHKAPVHKKTASPAKAVPAWETIHQSALIIDTHADTPQRFLDENFDLSQNTPVADGHIDFGKINKGRWVAVVFSIWVYLDLRGPYATRAMDLLDSVYQQGARHPE